MPLEERRVARTRCVGLSSWGAHRHGAAQRGGRSIAAAADAAHASTLVALPRIDDRRLPAAIWMHAPYAGRVAALFDGEHQAREWLETWPAAGVEGVL
jgi:hypothetical protein